MLALKTMHLQDALDEHGSEDDQSRGRDGDLAELPWLLRILQSPLGIISRAINLTSVLCAIIHFLLYEGYARLTCQRSSSHWINSSLPSMLAIGSLATARVFLYASSSSSVMPFFISVNVLFLLAPLALQSLLAVVE